MLKWGGGYSIGIDPHQPDFSFCIHPGCFSDATTHSPPFASVEWTLSNGSKFKAKLS